MGGQAGLLTRGRFAVLLSSVPPPEVIPYLTGEKRTSAHFEVGIDGWPLCPVCGEQVRDEGNFWEGHAWVGTKLLHPGCAHPQVIVVTSPHPPSVIGKLYVGTLKGFEPGRDPGDWWLILSDTADGWREVSIPWPNVRKVILRYD